MSETIIKVKPKELKWFIKHNYYLGRRGKSIFVIGGIGVGKSTIVKETAKEIAKELGKEFIEWNKLSHEEKLKLYKMDDISRYFIFKDERLSQIDVGDIRGIPFRLNSVVDWAYPLWLKVLSKPTAYGILFLDEINSSNELVQFASYQLVLDKALGDITLSENVMVIGAGNKVEEVREIFEMTNALKDRFVWVELAYDYLDWLEWASKNNIHPMIVTYIAKTKGVNLYIVDDRFHKPITPRSYHFASDLLQKCKTEREMRIVLASCLNTIIADEILTIWKLKEKFDVNQIVEGKVDINQFDLDEKYLALVLIVEEFKRTKDLKFILKATRNVLLKVEPEDSYST